MADKAIEIGIYDPYFTSTLGGGEKDVCVMAECLGTRYLVDLVGTGDVEKGALEARFNVNLAEVSCRKLLYRKGSDRGIRRILHLLQKSAFRKSISSGYDLFINLVNFLPFKPYAKKNVVRIQFPFERFRFPNFLGYYDHALAYSEYAQKWVRRRWGIDCQVIYPPVDIFEPLPKEPLFLSVGRFFKGGHCKKHLTMISTFESMYDSGFRDWEYHLVGARVVGKQHDSYLREIQEAAHGYPIFFHVDASFETLKNLYGRSTLYLHAAGFGEDPEEHPEAFEHFGITTVEAMSAGCVPLVFEGGGQPEIVQERKNGFLWKTQEQLIEKCHELRENRSLLENLSVEARKTSVKFCRKRYEKDVIEMVQRVMG